ncbi:unnamed protein product [Echinostoma caproni]|uniref:Uncharacterized protein n=1 Tax=Echinostoma caproni TaxID=27848 RepID=A0A183AR58_9TREM|nr:unnamed protein product [Echinostoma caproni]
MVHHIEYILIHLTTRRNTRLSGKFKVALLERLETMQTLLDSTASNMAAFSVMTQKSTRSGLRCKRPSEKRRGGSDVVFFATTEN